MGCHPNEMEAVLTYLESKHFLDEGKTKEVDVKSILEVQDGKCMIATLESSEH